MKTTEWLVKAWKGAVQGEASWGLGVFQVSGE